LVIIGHQLELISGGTDIGNAQKPFGKSERSAAHRELGQVWTLNGLDCRCSTECLSELSDLVVIVRLPASEIEAGGQPQALLFDGANGSPIGEKSLGANSVSSAKRRNRKQCAHRHIRENIVRKLSASKLAKAGFSKAELATTCDQRIVDDFSFLGSGLLFR
jgi:hypothetical protein